MFALPTLKTALNIGSKLLAAAAVVASISAGTWALSLRSQLSDAKDKIDSVEKALDGNKTELTGVKAQLKAKQDEQPKTIEKIHYRTEYIEREAKADYQRIDNYKTEGKNETNCSACYGLLRSIVD